MSFAPRRPCVAVVCREAGGPGSVAAVARRHAAELSREFDVLLVSDELPERAEPGTELVQVPRAGYGWARRFGHVPRAVRFATAACGLLAARHESLGLDAVICEGHVEAAFAVRTLGRTAALPTFVVCHGDIFARPPGAYDSLLTLLYAAATPVAYGDCDGVVVLSPAMGAWAERGGAAPERIRLIPNGISGEDIGLDGDGPWPRPPGERMEILFVGRLAVEKGVSDLLVAVGQVKRAGRSRFHFTIVGKGPQHRHLESLAAELGLSEDVTFLGAVERRSLAELYLAADIVCVPSRSEPQGIVVLEAMLCGCAVIGTKVDGIPSMITDGISGILVPPRDTIAMAQAILRLGDDLPLRMRLGDGARKRVVSDFTWAAAGSELRALVSMVLSPESRGCPRIPLACRAA